MKKFVTVFVGLLPASPTKNWLLGLLGHSINSDATISPIVILGSTAIRVGPGARVGALNVFRNVRVELASFAEIGQLNWISSAPFLALKQPDRGKLILGEHASITNRHYLDASGGIYIGGYTTIAGVRSVFITHGIDVRDSFLDVAPIQVGKYAMVGGSVKAVMGASVPDKSVVAMGSTIVGRLGGELHLFAGTPAKPKKKLREDDAYFHRELGKVPARPLVHSNDSDSASLTLGD